MKKRVRFLSIICVLVLAASVLAGCAGDSISSSTDSSKTAEKKSIDVLGITFTGTAIEDDEPAMLALEELTGYDVEMNFLLNSSYEDQLNTRMAAGNLPAVVAITGKTASVISNARAGAFWNITDEYKNYPNLAKANEIVMNNISIDGKIYGIYRSRPLGRNGICYRKDWLANVGMEEPKTMDDLYNMLKAFTYNDPDQNGKDDTYGMTWCKWDGPLDQLAVAFGAPNKYGVGDDGKLEPYFVTDEYMESMKFARKLYKEGLINQDFAAMETSDWQTDFKNGKSGVYIDVSDQARRFQSYFRNEKDMDDNVWVMGMVEGPDGVRRVQPISGHAGFVAITKSGAPKEQDMKDALAFLDILNTREGQDLISYGVEGVHYDLNDQGEIVAKTFPNQENPLEGFNQIMMDVADVGTPRALPYPVDRRVEEVQKENIDFVVANPTEPLTSNTYAEKGAQLDQLVRDARVQFVVGALDEAGFQAVVDQWFEQGGQEIVDEYTEAYEATK